MNWREVAPGQNGEALRLGLIAAMRQVYDENCQRYAPEDLGDNNKTFGISVAENLQFVIERDVVPFIPGIKVERPRNAWMIRLWTGVVLHVYKAPPGAADVSDLRFNASKTKLELVSENANQLAFDLGAGLQPVAPSALTHVVIVHFGGPLDGFQWVDVGAPVSTEEIGSEWLWTENLNEISPYVSDEYDESADGGSEAEDSDDFGLEMRDEDESEQDDDEDERRDLPGEA